jgi:SUMO ligase MMS21 Smc5/6 complex component
MVLFPPSQEPLTEERKIDEEMTIELDTVSNMADPFTKKPMQIPMRNKICNHVYDKASVEEVLRINPRTKCPMMGCPSNDFINLKDLVEDKKLRMLIASQQNKQNEEDDL